MPRDRSTSIQFILLDAFGALSCPLARGGARRATFVAFGFWQAGLAQPCRRGFDLAALSLSSSSIVDCAGPPRASQRRPSAPAGLRASPTARRAMRPLRRPALAALLAAAALAALPGAAAHPKAECDAIHYALLSMGVPISAGTGWGPSMDCCTFSLSIPERGVIRQVACENDHVVSFTWSDDNRIKFIDRSLRDSLPFLRSLKIERCLAITTTFPDWMTSWATIQELRLAGNKLTGIVPQDLRGMTKLAILDLSGNQLTGPIPAVPSSLRTCRFDNNNVCVHADAVFPDNMDVPCSRNLPICPPRTSTVSRTAGPATTTPVATFLPASPVPGSEQEWRFAGCFSVNNTEQADVQCAETFGAAYAEVNTAGRQPNDTACAAGSGLWCIIDRPVPVTLTTSFVPMPTEGPYLPAEATPLAMPDATVVQLGTKASFGPAGLLCSGISCSMSSTSAGLYRVRCPGGGTACGVFLLLDLGGGQDGCLSVLKGWSDPAVVPCATVKRTRDGQLVRRWVPDEEAAGIEGTDVAGVDRGPRAYDSLRALGFTRRQFNNLSDLTYFPWWSIYNISSDKTLGPLRAASPPVNVTKIVSAHLTHSCLVLPNASRPLGAVTIGDCDDAGSDGWTVLGLPSEGAPPPPAEGPSAGMIAGIVVGSCAAVALAAGLVYAGVRHSRSSDASVGEPEAAEVEDLKEALGIPKPRDKAGSPTPATAPRPRPPAAQPNGSETAFSDAASVDTDASSVLSRRTYGSQLSSSFSLTSSVDPTREGYYPYGYGYNAYFNRPPETRITSSLMEKGPGREVRPKHMNVMPQIPPPSPVLEGKQVSPSVPGSPTSVRSGISGKPGGPDAVSTRSGRSGRSGRRARAPGSPTVGPAPAPAPPAAPAEEQKDGGAPVQSPAQAALPKLDPIDTTHAPAAVASTSPATSEPTPLTPGTSPYPPTPVWPIIAGTASPATSVPPATPASPGTPASPAAAASPAVPLSPDASTPMYASPDTDHPYSHFVRAGTAYRIVSPYDAAEDDELSVLPGQLVRVDAAFRDGWGKCWLLDEHGKDVRVGMCPLMFLEPEAVAMPSHEGVGEE
ncbi:hypothetical protein DFJ74DRAFT_123511 [Hyaloraphidium curvatum]|nr:hypothetical protein DFJ74DRAFT_123511 [Hyaloraphidium curvatum]